MRLSERDHKLLHRADTLTREAAAVLADLGLPELFAPVGRSEWVGSSAFGLALTRDIDFDTLCPSLEAGPIWDVLRSLPGHPRVQKVRWTDQRGRFNLTEAPIEEGIYVGVHYYAGEVREDRRWKIDSWFLPDDLPRPTVALRERLLAATEEERLAILRIKDEAIRAGRYGPSEELHGYHVYEAVLDQGVRTYGAFLGLYPG